jgi:hypothetical protein
MIELTGITWNHTRGYLPMVATAQRFSELHPDVSITWHKRSLQQFADAPLSDLATRFDLMVIDHPSIGEAAQHNLLLTRPPTPSVDPTPATTTTAITTRLRSTPQRQSAATVPICSSARTSSDLRPGKISSHSPAADS